MALLAFQNAATKKWRFHGGFNRPYKAYTGGIGPHGHTRVRWGRYKPPGRAPGCAVAGAAAGAALLGIELGDGLHPHVASFLQVRRFDRSSPHCGAEFGGVGHG